MLEVLKSINHPGIVKSLHHFFVDKELWIIEDASVWEDGTLRQLMQESFESGLPERVICGILYHVLCAICHLHETGTVWHDVRAKNIFVKRDGQV